MEHHNKRRYRRIGINLEAEIVINAIDTHRGTLLDVSPGDLCVLCQAPVDVGDMATIYVRNFDVLPGRIVRRTPNGFASILTLSKARRRALTEKLFAQTNPHYETTIKERRNAPRHFEGLQPTICHMADGTSAMVKIINMSVNGAAVESRRRPATGSKVRLARRNGLIVRHTPTGFAISFDINSFVHRPSQDIELKRESHSLDK